MKPPLKELQYAVAETIAEEERAYDILNMCRFFGLSVQDDDNPWSSKRLYVLGLVKTHTESDLIDLAMKVSDYYQSDRLKAVLGRFIGGVSGDVKNLIFAANGPKPDLVLADAMHNVVDIVANAQYCLVYDKPITSKGLLWRDLVLWWQAKSGCEESQAEHSLYLGYFWATHRKGKIRI